MDENRFTEEDLICWHAHAAYLIWILNGEYALEDAREDLRGLIGSKFDPRVKQVKIREENNEQGAGTSESTEG